MVGNSNIDGSDYVHTDVGVDRRSQKRLEVTPAPNQSHQDCAPVDLRRSNNLFPAFVRSFVLVTRPDGGGSAAAMQPERLPLWRRLTVTMMEKTGLMARVQQAIR